MTLSLELSPELQQRLQMAAEAEGISPSAFAVKTLNERLLDADRRQRAIELLRSWRDPALADDQKKTGEYLIEVLDEDRTSDRKLFPPELKGISW